MGIRQPWAALYDRRERTGCQFLASNSPIRSVDMIPCSKLTGTLAAELIPRPLPPWHLRVGRWRWRGQHLRLQGRSYGREVGAPH